MHSTIKMEISRKILSFKMSFNQNGDQENNKHSQLPPKNIDFIGFRPLLAFWAEVEDA